MILETVCVGPMQVNCYILADDSGSEAIIIDPGFEEDKIKSVLDRHRLTPAFIINTHGHIDHIGCDDNFGVPVYIHQDDLAFLKDAKFNLSGLICAPFSVKSQTMPLIDKERIELGKIQLEVIHTPGHTPGGVCLLMKKPVNKILFTGDTLFYQGVGRTDFPGASSKQLLKSIKERLFILAGDTVIYPGHGPSSTLAEEKRNNFLF